MSACKPTGGPSRGRGPDVGQTVQPELPGGTPGSEVPVPARAGEPDHALYRWLFLGRWETSRPSLPLPFSFSRRRGHRTWLWGGQSPAAHSSCGHSLLRPERMEAPGPGCAGPRGHPAPSRPRAGPIPPGLRALPSPWGVSGSPSFLPAGCTPSVGFLPFPLRAQAFPASGGEEGAWICRKDTAIASH